jgi:hypothetical protein
LKSDRKSHAAQTTTERKILFLNIRCQLYLFRLLSLRASGQALRAVTESKVSCWTGHLRRAIARCCQIQSQDRQKKRPAKRWI